MYSQKKNRKKIFDCVQTARKKIPIGISLLQEIWSKDMRDQNLNESNACPWGGGVRCILFTKWLGDAWEDYTKNHQDENKTAFKKCGTYNDTDGKENHRIKINGYQIINSQQEMILQKLWKTKKKEEREGEMQEKIRATKKKKKKYKK